MFHAHVGMYWHQLCMKMCTPGSAMRMCVPPRKRCHLSHKEVNTHLYRHSCEAHRHPSCTWGELPSCSHWEENSVLDEHLNKKKCTCETFRTYILSQFQAYAIFLHENCAVCRKLGPWTLTCLWEAERQLQSKHTPDSQNQLDMLLLLQLGMKIES